MAQEAISKGAENNRNWWTDREGTKQEAQKLATYLLKNQSVIVNKKRISLSNLPPETIGPMVYLLTESFVESWAEEQEKAIVLLLSHLRSWRHFIEVLEHCSKNGSKVNSMNSLNRLNMLLDGTEQQQFNSFIKTLAVNTDTSALDYGTLAWSPGPSWRKESTLLAAKRSDHFEGLV